VAAECVCERRVALRREGGELGYRVFSRRPIVDRFADGADRLGECLDRMLWGDIAGVEMHLRRPMITARDEAVEDLTEKAALLGAEPAHDAEVDGDQLAVVVDEQIAR